MIEDEPSIALALRGIAAAITPIAYPGTDAAGGHVESLTEAIMGITAGLMRVAEAIDNLTLEIEAR